jgi:membrane protein implicated in regulation of membrane protease activity
MSFLFWLSVAVATLIIEIISLSFFFVFFAFAAFVTAALVYFGALPELAPQIVVFALVALVSLWLLRRDLQQSLATPGLKPADVEQKITLSASIAPGGEASIDYQGSSWTAQNTEAQPMAKGDTVVIIKTDGVKLLLGKGL